MYLKKLELQGFKSFANKTVFDFSSGITAIVGPNGSGKSNVIDALRWILGESSAKNMRADKSENLIFSGTSKKARSSMAEVSVTFDNSSQFFPVDFSEVVIRRRVTRDGVSKYWINESAVRLRDIVDLFAQARLGTQFSIVSQGSADSFIAASPTQRREMMEEILGLRRYQIKRRDAKNKLALTQTNLERVRALIEELLPHLRLLRRQAKKWERAGEVEKELLEVEKRYFGARIKALSVMDARIVPLEKELKEKHERARTEVKAAQDAFALVEKRAPKKEEKGELRARYEKLFSERGELERRLGSLEAEIRILSSTKSVPLNHQLLLSVASSLKDVLQNISQFNFDSLKEKLLSLKADLFEALGEKENDNSQAEEKEALEKDKKALAAKLDACTKEIDSLKEQLNAAESSDDSFHAEFKAAFSVLESAKEALASIERELSALALDKERAAMKRSDLLEQLEQAGKRIADFAPSTEDLNDSQIHEIERLMLSLRAELSSIGDVDNTLIQESKDMEERHAYLVKESEDLQKACSDLKVLIKDLKEKLHSEFKKALVRVNEEFNKYFHAMFVGGKARLSFIQEEVAAPAAEEVEGLEVESASDDEDKNSGGLDIEISIPRKNIKGLDMLSGGERSLTSIAVLFALVSVSPPPFLVLDEVDAALDENNTKRFASLIHEFSEKTQFMVVTHNRATMGEADVLYGVTMGDDGTSTVLSLKFDQVSRNSIG